MKIRITKHTALLVITVLMISLLSGCQMPFSNLGTAANSVPNPEYWPTEGWKTSTPEAQGMDSKKIDDMFENIEMHGYDIHHVLIIKNGYKVAECNYYPYQQKDLHVINSITKNFTSALVGKAIDDGLIKNVDEKVLSYFKDETVKNPSDEKSALTLEHLLTMSTGYQWSEDGNYGAPYDSNTQLWKSNNQVQFMLDLPVVNAPGTDFYYNTGASHLLSGILNQVTKKTSEAYAKEAFLNPLGIKTIYWGKDNQGINVGGSRLFISAEDLAKFGFLYLHNGKWNDQQLLSSKWVTQSTSKQIDTPNGLAGRSGYGYQWWMNPYGGFSGRGFGGQFLFVLPKENLVVVFNSALAGSEFSMPETLVGEYLVPAVLSDQAIAENLEANAALKASIETLEKGPAAKNIPDLPPMAAKISGKSYPAENSEVYGLDFTAGSDTAILHWFTDGVQYDVPVGLDGLYRISSCPEFYSNVDGFVSQVAYRGTWKDESTFVIDVRPIEDNASYTLTLSFKDDQFTNSFVSNLTGK